MRAKKPELNHLHNMSIFEIVELMNEEDTTVARIVKKNLPEITNAIEPVSYTHLRAHET